MKHCVSLFIHFGAARADLKARPQLSASESKTQSASRTLWGSFRDASALLMASFDLVGSLPSRKTILAASSICCQSMPVRVTCRREQLILRRAPALANFSPALS